MATLRSRNWFGPRTLDGFMHRAYLRAEGFSDLVFDGRPVVGIANSWSELNNCNAHLRQVADAVKRGVWAAGGFPLEFPTISLGEILMKPTTMLFRNLMAMDVEECIRAYPLDAVVLLSGCDKTTPAMLMGAASADVPSIMVTGGPMLRGNWRAEELGSGTDARRLWAERRAGRLTDEEMCEVEACLSRSTGHCMVMGTASTMASMAEALGIALPGNAAIPAPDSRRLALAELSGRRAVEMAIAGGPKPSEILTPKAFDNAIRSDMAIGGSTNAIVHLVAIAGRIGVRLPLERFDELSRTTPLIVNLKPSGKYLMEDFFYAGGLPVVLKELLPLLHGDALAVNGRTLADNVRDATCWNEDVIRPLAMPLAKEGGTVILFGNLFLEAPGRLENPGVESPQQKGDSLMEIHELDRLGDEIAELSAHIEAATARLLDLIREFDTRGGWNTGFRSCAAWLSWRVGLDLGAARERVRVARALGTLPLLARALARGELSYAKVRALTRVATPETEARLLTVGRAGTAAHVERIVRGWRRVDRQAEARETARRHASRALHVYQDEDGMVVLRGRLSPEVGALLVQALTAAREALYQQRRASDVSAETLPPDVSAETPSMAQQQADALALLAETALHRGIDPGAPGERYQVVVHVDAPVLADPDAPGQSVLEDGTHVSAETSRRLACDASRVVMRHAPDGQIVEVGARTRTIPPALRRALHHRDQGCRFPGCGLPFGQGHHIRHWAQGGPTTLSNLALLCRRHHRAVHEEGYQVNRQPDGELRFRRPDGRLLPEVPPAAAIPADPVQALRARHEAQGLRLHPRTAIPGWLGEPLNVGWAIDVLHPLAG